MQADFVRLPHHPHIARARPGLSRARVALGMGTTVGASIITNSVVPFAKCSQSIRYLKCT